MTASYVVGATGLGDPRALSCYPGQPSATLQLTGSALLLVVAVSDREVGEILEVLRAAGGTLHRPQVVQRADRDL
ncbi:hypothetical protein BH20ACT16_BH20ACT16_11610 [soil metagenome]